MVKSLNEIIQNPSPIVFLFGEEEFILEEALEKIINRFCPDKNHYDFDLLDGAQINENILVDKCSSYPMINDKRVVIIKNAEKLFTSKSKKPDKNSLFYQYLSNPSSSTLLIITAFIDNFTGIGNGILGKNKQKYEKMIENAKFPYNILLTKFNWMEFPKLYDNQIPYWIKDRFKLYNKKIDDEAANLLFAFSNGELRDIANEIEKICLFVEDRQEITRNDISAVSGNRRLNNVFELQNAIGAKDSAKANEILFNMLLHERQEMLIITMLTRYFIAVWKVQELLTKNIRSKEIASMINVNEYFINDYIKPAKLFSNKAVEQAIIHLCEADFELKSSSSNNLLIMQKLIEKIISSD